MDCLELPTLLTHDEFRNHEKIITTPMIILLDPVKVAARSMSQLPGATKTVLRCVSLCVCVFQIGTY